jgi:hypothetical protein
MKLVISRRGVLLACALGVARLSSADPPPNDNFADRIILTGTFISFTGTLAGATAEYPGGWSEPSGSPFTWYPEIAGGPSVWWEWTAPTSGPVTLVLEVLEPPGLPKKFGINAAAVYKNCEGFPTNNSSGCPGYALSGVQFDLAMPQCLQFSGQEGMTYFILLLDSPNYRSGANYKMTLSASNAPFIIEQPKTQTVSTNASALFTVLACGLLPLSYQWRFNGTDLAGETNASLALSAVSNSVEGSYSVVVSNGLAAKLSESANLNISKTDVRPVLNAIGSNQSGLFQLGLTGEPGRYYRIEASTNLLDWSAEPSIPLEFLSAYGSQFTSVFFSANGFSVLGLPLNTDQRFFRASRYSPANEICNNNLRRIRLAKEAWARENRKGTADTPADTDLFPHYLGQKPACPEGGIYWLNAVDWAPTCTISNHMLEVPR